MSALIADPIATGVSNFRAILNGLGDSPQECDSSARREAALLAFGRRTSAQPQVSLLMQDAGALLTEVLHVDLSGVAETTGPHSLSLTVNDAEEHGKTSQPMVHTGPVDPASSMAAYTMNAAQPVISENLVHDPRFSDAFLRQVGAVSGLAVPLHAGDR